MGFADDVEDKDVVQDYDVAFHAAYFCHLNDPASAVTLPLDLNDKIDGTHDLLANGFRRQAERLLLGSGVVGPGQGNRAEGIWCASKSGSS